ncbi:MAG TPA: hypothetical protein PKA00_13895 [Saprospiraceae bacterium]|nr:hypothetical protein [Saprospiraceae bacterium]
MKIQWSIMISIGLLSIASCGSDTSSQNNATNATQDSTTVEGNRASDVPAQPDCQLTGSILEGNQYWDRDMERLLCIKADSSTLDPTLGESHRVLEVYDTRNCTLLDRQTLPVNVSPDFPYYLAEINYNKDSRLFALRGFGELYLYDLSAQKLSPALSPAYFSERYGADAQSGMIQRLEVWENYLVGYARDYGAFAFDLSDKTKVKAVLPFAEYNPEEVRPHSLFLLSSDNDQMQAILPQYDSETDQFSINPLFDTPMKINTNVAKSARNNRHLVLRTEDAAKTPIAIDLEKHQQVALPADVAAKTTQEILQWMKRN